MAKALSKAQLFMNVGTEMAPDWVQIAHLTSVAVPSAEKTEVKVTDMDSDAEEFLPGLSDFGELPFAGQYNAGNEGQEAAIADAQDPDAVTRSFRVDLVNVNKRFTFTGFIKSAKIKAELNVAYTFDGSVRVSGAVTPGVISST